MSMKSCPLCTLFTSIPHDPDGRDCLRGWAESAYTSADLLLTQIGCPEVINSPDRWPNAKTFQGRLQLAHQRLAAWENLYHQIADLLREADLPVPQWDDPDMLEKLQRDVQITVKNRIQKAEDETIMD